MTFFMLTRLVSCLVNGTDIDICHLFLNLSALHANSDTRVIASLEAERAFDFEWMFLFRGDA